MTPDDHAEMSAKIDKLNEKIYELERSIAKEEQIRDIVERLYRGDTLEEACIYVAEKEQLDTYLRNAISNNKKGTQ